MDYSKFKNWKNSHSTEMKDFTFAKSDDIYVFTRFTNHLPVAFEGKQVLFAESLEEVAGYIRHIFLYDILNDATDDLEINFSNLSDERQKDAITLSVFWFKAGKLSLAKDFKELQEFCDKFNLEFNHREKIEYELEVFNGVDELRDFLIRAYTQYEDFDKQRLCKICSKESFSGELLNKFLDNLFR